MQIHICLNAHAYMPVYCEDTCSRPLSLLLSRSAFNPEVLAFETRIMMKDEQILACRKSEDELRRPRYVKVKFLVLGEYRLSHVGKKLRCARGMA